MQFASDIERNIPEPCDPVILTCHCPFSAGDKTPR
jgi:hypothetical protein